jgi:hypothetical protein
MEGSLDSQGPGANEAMYFDIPPLNESQFIILDDEEALEQQTKLLVESQNLNNRHFPPWDDANFSKIKFYTKEIDINQEYQQQFLSRLDKDFTWKRMNEVSMNPSLIVDKLLP